MEQMTITMQIMSTGGKLQNFLANAPADARDVNAMPYTLVCMLVSITLYQLCKIYLRNRYEINIGAGLLFIPRYLAGITMLAPAFFGNVIMWDSFRGVWESDRAYQIWFWMAISGFLLLALALVFKMHSHGVPFWLYLPTIIVSYMSTIWYPIISAIGVIAAGFILILGGGGALLASTNLTQRGTASSDSVCKYCGHAKPAFGNCRNCGK